MQTSSVNFYKDQQQRPIKNMSVDEFSEILEEIKKEDLDYSDKQIRKKGATRKCKKAFKREKKPIEIEVLLIELAKELKKNERYYDNYIQRFLPALLEEMIQSKKIEVEKIEKVLRITSYIIKQSSKEECNSLFSNLETKITESIKLSSEEKTKRKKMIMRLKISDDLKKLLRNEQQDNINTFLSGEGFCSRANSSVLSKKKSLSSQVSNRRESVNTKLSLVEKYDDLQREEIENQTQTNHLAKKDQGMQENENSELKKQPNNRNFSIMLIAFCTLSVECFIAGVVTLGIVEEGIGLLIMSVAFVIAAVVTQHLITPSSKLTFTDLNPFIGSSKQL